MSQPLPRAALDCVPMLEVCLHSDLELVGAACSLSGLTPGRSLRLGRASPLFEPLEAGPQRTLEDPCISREQLQLECVGQHRYRITPLAAGRREIALYDLAGQAVALKAVVEPGTLIAIGDRVLLLLTLRPERHGRDRLGFIGESMALWRLREQIERVGRAAGTVLIEGESGAGKERVASALHACGPRPQDPYLGINCAALASGLLESELFGYVRGAFTGAAADRPGLFQAAGHGTLFLDEIGELPLELQGKLLRVLQERNVVAVGDRREQPVHARVMAATNRDLRLAVHRGQFREDLYFRLATHRLDAPPLREHREDVPLLFARFLSHAAAKDSSLARLTHPADRRPPAIPLSFMLELVAHVWPGNVRELSNVVERTAAASRGQDLLCVEGALGETATGGLKRSSGVEAEAAVRGQGSEDGTLGAAGTVDGAKTLWTQGGAPAREVLLELLEQHDYIQGRVARAVGVSHTTVDRWMQERGLRRPRDLSEAEIAAAAERAGGNLREMARELCVSQRGLKLRLIGRR